METPTIPTGAPLVMRQLGAMLGLELRKTFLRLRALPVVVIAFLPATLALLRLAGSELGSMRPTPAAEMALSYANLFQFFFLRLVVFFVAFAVFTYLVRGETAERSLHFYLLAPLDRSVFLLGKYLAGLLGAGALVLASLAVQLLLLFLPAATTGGGAYLFGGPGAGHAAAYAAVSLLAVAGYGAVFTALALVVRNPMLPAAAILGWEWVNPFLPSLLQKASVIHHLQALCPLPVARGPWALPAEPTAAPLAIVSLLALAGLLLVLAARRARRLEVRYAGD
ncbi:MAG: hypothetical protein F9K16_13225 [Thermoanaerobaculia bacterium]|nr:MAG: hypothetical protein F9K16_13225 [Thermoanaerobaculia bacterium]MBZ0101864.1 hypothetical protein [Thermoanaerobaculia bacterium]